LPLFTNYRKVVEVQLFKASKLTIYRTFLLSLSIFPEPSEGEIITKIIWPKTKKAKHRNVRQFEF